MKTISILLTKYSDFYSSLLYHVTGQGYTHISLGLDDEEARFYSFNYKGFCIETMEKHRRHGVNKSVCYQLIVTDSVHDNIQQKIKIFVQHQREYQYTLIGLLFAILHIPFHWKKHYICSQFVAELLTSSGAVPLSKNASVYLPNQFPAELERSPSLTQIIYNPR